MGHINIGGYWTQQSAANRYVRVCFMKSSLNQKAHQFCYLQPFSIYIQFLSSHILHRPLQYMHISHEDQSKSTNHLWSGGKFHWISLWYLWAVHLLDYPYTSTNTEKYIRSNTKYPQDILQSQVPKSPNHPPPPPPHTHTHTHCRSLAHTHTHRHTHTHSELYHNR